MATLKTYTATFERQLFPWTDVYKTTRTFEASSKGKAREIAESFAASNTKMIRTQAGELSFIGKVMLISVK